MSNKLPPRKTGASSTTRPAINRSSVSRSSATRNPAARSLSAKRLTESNANDRNRAVDDAPNVRGASSQQTERLDRWKAYLAHHSHSGQDSLRRLLVTPLQSLLTLMVLAVALALPAMLFVSMDNLQALGQRWDGAPQLSVFINPRAKPAAIKVIERDLSRRLEVQQVTYISPQQALADFEAQSNLGSALRSLDSNPLPPALIITPELSISPAALAELGRSIGELPAVDEVVFDQAWVQRLHELLRLGETLSLSLGALLALGVILVIGNTIRLAIESRRDEIVIIKLVGGTNAFVRRPFLYTGLWFGCGGGLLALLLLVLGLQSLAASVTSLASLYGSDFQLQGVGLEGGLLLVGLASLIGWLGAWLAVGRHLGEIEPQ